MPGGVKVRRLVEAAAGYTPHQAPAFDSSKAQGNVQAELEELKGKVAELEGKVATLEAGGGRSTG